MGLENDAESKARIRAFEGGLAKEGWALNQDLAVEYRFASSDARLMRAFAKELVDLQVDVLVGHSTPVVGQLVRATQTIPVVFVVVADPVGSGFVESISRPGGNATGFTNLAPTITGKLLTILKQIAPDMKRVALLFSPDASIGAGSLFLKPLQTAGPSFSVKVISAPARAPGDIEKLMTDLAAEPHNGLIVMPDNFTTMHRKSIISLAERLRIPAVYPYRFFADAGGLLSYGVDVPDLFRRSSDYVSRILRGQAPGELPVQAPTKFELAINLKTAKALGLTVPRILLAGADALIE
jgi:putative ABC transport system substrate-binding protein